MNLQTAFHITPVENLPSIFENGLQPQIGDLSKERGETEQRVYLFVTQDDYESGLSTWLGEYFEEPEKDLLILEIDVTGLALESDVAYEIACKEVVSPSRIVSIVDELGLEIYSAAGRDQPRAANF